MMPGWLTLKLGAMILAAAAILSFVVLAFHWKNTMTERGEKLAIICKATGEAADNPKLRCGNVVIQIQELGASVKNTKAALERQNAAVNALGLESNRQQAEAAKAVLSARGRARDAEATSSRLAASARSAVPSRACEPSKTLQETWR